MDTNISGPEIVHKYEYFLFDCDGVLWTGDKVFDGARELIKLLIQKGKQVYFVTNNSSRSRKVVLEHATNLGFDGDNEGILKIEQFYPSSYATALYCKTHIGSKKVLNVGLDGLREELENQNIEVVAPHKELTENSRINESEFAAMTVDPTIDTVVSGIFPNWTYRLQCYISKLVRGDGISNGASYVSSNIDN